MSTSSLYFRKLLLQLGEWSGLFGYTQKQTFVCEMQTLIEPDAATRTIVVPMPIETDTQKLLGWELSRGGQLVEPSHEDETCRYVLFEAGSERTVIEQRGRVVIDPSRRFNGRVLDADRKPDAFVQANDPRIRQMVLDLGLGCSHDEAGLSPCCGTRLAFGDARARTVLAASRSLFHRVMSIDGPRHIYDSVIKHLTYGNPTDGLYSALDALERDCVDCGGFSTLFAALCRSLQIPARLVSGFWVGDERNEMHAWAEYFQGGYWHPVDLSTDALRREGRSRKSGGFNKIGSDHLTISKGSSFQLETGYGFITIPLLQHAVAIHRDGTLSYLPMHCRTKRI